MSTQSLQLLAVGFSARWMQESAFRGGLRSHAVDFFADADTRRFGPVTKVARWREVPRVAATLRPEAILVGAGFETQLAIVKRLRAVAPLFNSTAVSALASRNPVQWAAALQKSGLLIPRMVPQLARGFTEEELGKGRWLVKSRRSAGGNRVRVWKHVAPQSLGGDRLARGEYLQQRIEGEPYSLLFWLQPCQRCCLGVFRQLCGVAALGAKPFQFAGAVGPLPFDAKRAALIQGVGDQLYAELGLTGLIGVDLIQSSEGLFAIEINPRPTATAELWERAFSNQSLVKALWESHAGKLERGLSVDGAIRAVHGKGILYWRESRPLIVNQSRADIFQRAWLEGWLKDLPAEGTLIEPGEPVATVFAEGVSEEVVRAELLSRADKLRIQLVGGGAPTDDL